MHLSRLARTAIHSIVWSLALLYATWSAASIAQVAEQVVTAPGTQVVVQPNPNVHSSVVTTTVASPDSTVKTTITSVMPKSRMIKTSDGTLLAIDSDSSVKVVYPDGARTTPNDGNYTLADGSSLNVRSGKMVP